MHKFYKHLIAGVSAFVMCLSAVPLSASAEITSTSTSVQQVSNQDVYNQVLALGFDEDEAQYIVDNVDADEILSILGTNTSSVSRSTTSSSHNLSHATYTNVSTWNNDNSCGSVASAIFLVYLSCYHYPEISYSSPYNLYLSLKPYIETISNARVSNLDALESGLGSYLTDIDTDGDIGLGDYVRSEKYSNSTSQVRKMCLLMVARLNRDEPVIALGQYSSTSILGHFVVVEGLDVVNNDSGLDLANTYIYVNDGYGNRRQKINLYNFVSAHQNYGIVYLF